MAEITKGSQIRYLLILFCVLISLSSWSGTYNYADLNISIDSTTNPTCFGSTNGIIDITVSGGDGNYTYSWTGPGSFTSSNEDIQNLPSGSYTIQIEDGDNNTAEKTIVLEEPSPITATDPTSTVVSCNGFSDGTVTAGTPTGGNGSFTYSIDGTNFQNSKSFNNLSAGNYVITIRDAKNCEITQDIEVTEPSPITATDPTFTVVSCNGFSDGTVTAGNPTGGNGSFTYSIDGTNFQNSQTFNNLSAGNYVITIRDAKNCEITQDIEVTEPSPITATDPTFTVVSCNGFSDGTVTAGNPTGGNGSFTYSIDGTNFQNSQTFNNLPAGNYIITIRDAKNCEITQDIEVTEPSPITATNPSSTVVSCNGFSDGTVTAGTPTGGNGSFTYSIDGANFQNSQTFNNLPAGNYIITIRDAKNCEITQDIEVTEPSPITATNPSSTVVSCNGFSDGTVTAGNPTGGNGSFTYSIDGTNFQSSKSFNNLSAGNYTITIRDAKNCKITQNIEVTEPSPITATDPSSTVVSCNGFSDGTVTAGTPTGGNGSFTYSIDGTNFQNSKSFNNLSAGNYVITIRDAKNCEITQDIEVTEPSPITATDPTFTVVSCNGFSDGTVTAGNPTGGNGSFTYSIDGTNFQNSQTFNNLPAGNYIITIRDAKNCEITQDIEVTEPSPITATNPSSTVVSCNGFSDGTVTAGTPTGGNGSFTYSIDGANFQNSQTFNNLPAGNYIITIRDAKNCEITQDIEVTEPEAITATDPSATVVSCNGFSDGTITAGTPSGGNGNFTYSIDGVTFQNSKTFNDLPAGNYIITIRDNKNCEITQDIEVTEPSPITATNPTATVVNCNGFSDGTITAGTPTGGNGSFTYSIDGTNFQNSKTFNNLAAGDYTITIKDAKNCEFTQNIEVTEPEALSISGSTTNPTSCYEAADGSLTAGTVTGGTPPYQYSIDNTNFQSSTDFSDLTAGDYTIFIQDANNCALQDFVTITEPDVLNATLSKTNVLCNGGSSGTIALSDIQGGSNSYEFSLDSTTWQTESTFTGLSAGTYPVYIRDANANSCVILLNNAYEITEPEILQVTASSSRTTSYGSPTGSATVNATGGTQGYTYEWTKVDDPDFSENTKSINNIYAGDYEVIVTDQNGCKSPIVSISVVDAVYANVLSATMCEGAEPEEGQVRTAYFSVEKLTAVGGDGDYTYNWNFGDGKTAVGPGEHTINYSTKGNKTITLTVRDNGGTGETYTITEQLYVGECHEPCGKAENAIFDVDKIYIGYLNGDSMEGNLADLCNPDIDKYLFLPVDKSVNMYNPYTETTFKTTNSISNTIEPQNDSECRLASEIDQVPPGDNQGKEMKVGEFIQLTRNPIKYQCGDNVEIEGFYITYTNNTSKGCKNNNNGFCYSINEPIVVPTPVGIQATPSNVQCKSGETGNIILEGTGGFAPYTFYYVDNDNKTIYSSNNRFDGLMAGEYTIYIEDKRNNTDSTTVTIEEPAFEVSAKIDRITNPVCYGETGEATATGAGGTPSETGDGYEYLWNDASEQTTATATGLSPGEYTVTVTDANGCQAIKTVTIVEPPILTTPEAGTDQILTCGTNTTNLQANTPTEGIGTWTIDPSSSPNGVIDDTSNPNSEFNGPAGTYTLIWTIANADGTCAESDSVVITIEGNCSFLDFDGVDDHVFFDNNYGFSTGKFTIEVWVKPESTTGIQTVFSKRDKSNISLGGYDLIINNGSPTFRWKGQTATTSKKLTTSRWYHLAVIFDGSSARLYVDGLDLGNANAANPASISAPFLLGAMYDSQSPLTPKNHYSGWMEELRIWNTALSQEQLRFMMNQRIKANGANTKGEILPMDVPGPLTWSKLVGYYHLNPADITQGLTPDISGSPINGVLKNIKTNQSISAPLPYVSDQNGTWRNKATWDKDNVKWWDVPNGKGINDKYINWNIAQTSHDINSGFENIYLLGLLSESGKILMDGSVTEKTGNGLTVTKYLKLNGSINLDGQSQLVQTENSILEPTSSGHIEIDQQGTRNSFNYNYWSSPVSLENNTSNNTGFKLSEVLYDGSTSSPGTISFNKQYHWADGNYTGDTRISTYWLYSFQGTADDYSEWHRFDENTLLDPGIGYTMKGTRGYVPLSQIQNYTFKGKPNNGDIRLSISSGQNLLIGNPYPSAIDANKFIETNLNSFNGSIYYWDHFGKEDSHYLEEYVGGYAAFNLSGGVEAATSSDSRINDNNESGNKTPGNYIPVGQAFFVNSTGVNNPGTIVFKNEQRAFVREATGDSQFLVQEKPTKKDQATYTKDSRYKIRLKFKSPKGYNRQILVTADSKTTAGYDMGYDAPLIDDIPEDMYWMIEDSGYVIQAVPDFNIERVLPIGIKIAEEGEFSIELDKLENFSKEIDVFVHDLETDLYYNITKAPFKKQATAGESNNQFEIVFFEPASEDNSTEEETDEEETEEETTEEETEENSNEEDVNTGEETGNEPENENPDGDLNINSDILVDYLRDTKELILTNPDLQNISNVEVFSITGQSIQSFNNIPVQKSVNLQIERPLSSAIYVVRIYTGKKEYSRKIIVQN